MGRWSRKLAPGLIEFASVADRDRVLDVGTGIGSLAFSVVQHLPRASVTGIELSPGFVRRAHAARPCDRASFVIGDGRALPFADASFDRALSLFAINFIPDPSGALREMARVTRPGGTVSAAVWDYGDGMQMLSAFWSEAVAIDPAVEPRDERHMPLCRQGELGEMWRSNELRDVEERALTIELSFRSFDDYWSPFLGGIGPAGVYARSLAPRARDELAAKLRARLVGASDGPFALTARAWAVRGIVRRAGASAPPQGG